jgi:hypothetical protein
LEEVDGRTGSTLGRGALAEFPLDLGQGLRRNPMTDSKVEFAGKELVAGSVVNIAHRREAQETRQGDLQRGVFDPFFTA